MQRAVHAMSRRAPLTAGVAALAVLSLVGCARLRVSPVEHYRAAAPGTTAGGRLVVGIEPPDSIDPARVDDDAGRLVSSLICEPLIQLDPRTGHLAHGIVTAVTTAGNGAAFTLALRSDVRFQNGQALTAQDVVYALSRVARHETAAPLADVLQPVLGYGELHAPPSPTDTRPESERVLTGVRAISKYALQITLSTHNAAFLRALTLPLAAPVPRRLPDRRSDFSDAPVCAGPYRLVHPYHYGDATIDLRRFRGYYGADDAYVGRGKGFADEIEFVLLPRRGQLAAYAAGQLDLAEVSPAELRRARLPGEVVTAPRPEVEFLGTTVTSGPLSDPHVRRVLSRSLDRTRLVADVFGGGRLPADRMVPPGSFAAPAPAACREAAPATAQPPTGADRALVAPLVRTGVVLTVNDDFSNVPLARAVAAQWRATLGLPVRVVAETWDRLQLDLAAPGGLPGLFRTSWRPVYPSEDATLRPLFGSAGLGTDNVARYRSRGIDRLLDRKAPETIDDDRRSSKYAAAEQLACEDLPLIPLTFGQAEYAVQSGRIGRAATAFTEPATGLPDLREIYVRRSPR